jgi:hypothetical protein
MKSFYYIIIVFIISILSIVVYNFILNEKIDSNSTVLAIIVSVLSFSGITKMNNSKMHLLMQFLFSIMISIISYIICKTYLF